jgi:glyceraldehyde 3-phosphate dehydrogenase
MALVMPELKGKFHGISLRVPTPNVSLVDLTVMTRDPVSVETINEALREAAASDLKGILAVTEDELVSSDFKGNPYSSIVDAPLTMVVGDRHGKVFAWYDNEWGYSCRVVDLTVFMGDRLN